MDVVDVATTYLDALVSRDADHARLARGIRRINNGVLAVEGADAIREIIRNEPPTVMSDRRWVVDGEDAVAFYDVEATVRGDRWPAYIAEHFVVRDELVHELDIVFSADTTRRPRPEHPRRYPEGDDPRDVVLDISRRYVSALTSHDASDVPLADGAYRIENGGFVGTTGPEIRAALETDGMSIVDRVEDLRWFADTGRAAAFYTLFANIGDDAQAICRIGERFRVYREELVEIEVVIATTAADTS
jgi:hypothetical protein